MNLVDTLALLWEVDTAEVDQWLTMLGQATRDTLVEQGEAEIPGLGTWRTAMTGPSVTRRGRPVLPQRVAAFQPAAPLRRALTRRARAALAETGEE